MQRAHLVMRPCELRLQLDACLRQCSNLRLELLLAQLERRRVRLRLAARLLQDEVASFLFQPQLLVGALLLPFTIMLVLL